VLVAEMKLLVICFYIVCGLLLVSCACEFGVNCHQYGCLVLLYVVGVHK